MAVAMRYAKAIAAAISAFIGVVVFVLADDSVTFQEVDVLWAAVVALIAAVGTAISPKNSEV
jgi:hypothetical protein